jgi:hypothetical protein
MKLILGIVCADIPQRLKISSRYVDHNLYSQEKALERRAIKIFDKCSGDEISVSFSFRIAKKIRKPYTTRPVYCAANFPEPFRPQILEKKKMAQ